jgi:hypothetical protein
MSARYSLTVWYTCGHTTVRDVPMETYHKQKGQPLKPGYECYSCKTSKAHSAYMRELEVKAAFNSECV